MTNKLAVLALLALGPAACIDDDPPVDENGPKQHLPRATAPDLTVFVANKSLDKTTLDIQVRINDQLAISGDFNVFRQVDEHGEGCGVAMSETILHNWYQFDFALPWGTPHKIEVISSDSVATNTQEVTLAYGGPKFALVQYNYDATIDLPEGFAFETAVEPPALD